MIALVGAMFVALAPVRAHSVGECSDAEYLEAAKCRMEVGWDHDENPSTPNMAFTAGSDPDASDPWDEFAHDASTHGPSVTITFNDSDGIVSPLAGQLTGTITVSGILELNDLTDGDDVEEGVQHNGTQVGSAPTLEVAWVRVSGELDHAIPGGAATANARMLSAVDDPNNDDTPRDTESATDDPTIDNSAVSIPFTVIIPAGTTQGDYTVSTTVLSRTDDADPLYNYSGEPLTAGAKSASKSFTVGDAGIGLSTATLSLGNRKADVATTVSDEAKPESGSDVADGDGINLVVTASNSLGNKSNNGDVSRITVIAAGANIEIGTSDGHEANASGDNDSESMDGVGQLTRLKVRKADGKPGSVDVYAILTGPSGAAVSETLTLNFTGDASALALGDPSGSLHNQSVSNAVAATADSAAVADSDHRDRITIALSATDAGANTADVPNVRISITDPKGATVGTTRIAREQVDKAPGENNQIRLDSLGSASNPLAAGEYTLKVVSGDNEAEVTFVVAGAPDAIGVSATTNTDDVQLGSLVTVEATVTSGDSNVSEGTLVDFASGGSLELDPVGKVEGVKTKGGVAKAKFIVSSGSGLGTIIVTSGDADGTATVTLPGAEAMADEEASVACLSNLAGFSTWSCGVETSASEIFGFVSARGATAIHLWNGSAWVRYSVVDGTMVPGSSDFMVAENDILYISN